MPSLPSPENRSHLARIVLAACAIALILALIAAPIRGLVGPDFLKDFSEAALTARIRSWGPWGVVGSMALMMAHSVLPFPAEMLALANGMVYGPLWGTAVTWCGAMLAAHVAFAIARGGARPIARRMLRSSSWRQLEEWFATVPGSLALLYARLVPIIAFNLVNFAAGLTKASWWTYSWTTAIGILPMSILTALMGSYMWHVPWWAWLGGIFLALISWPVVHRLLARRMR